VDAVVSPAYTQRLDLEPIPKYRMPERGAAPEVVYRLIHDELLLDGSSRLNLATFVTTWMEPEAGRLMAEWRATDYLTANPPRTSTASHGFSHT
jgi:glutamate decarboxylase